MTKRSQQILAMFLILLGVLYLAANFFDIDPGNLFWPLAFIAIGVILIFRPKSITPEHAEHYFAKDIHVGRNASPGDKEVRMFAGDTDIDQVDMDLEPGETLYSVRFFAGDITVDVPEDVGLKIDSTGFVVEVKIDGESTSNVMTGYSYKSDNYDSSDKKFILSTTAFAVDLKIRNRAA